MRHRLGSLAFAIAALPFLSGCVFFEGPVSRQMEKSPDFKAGYSDGCATSSSQSANYRREQTVVKDQALFKTDKAYRAGWSAGYTGCRPMTANDETKRGPIPDPYPPH
jgi:hypothetical protein